MAASNNAINKPVAVSPVLEDIVGKGPMPRGQVTAKVWDYIKANRLQASDDKRMIVPDARLGKVIGNDKISMFKMTAAVSKHLG